MGRKQDAIIDYAKDMSKAGGLAVVLTLVFIMIQTALMMFTKLSESVLPITNSIIMAISITIASIYISIKREQKGWLNGAAIGLIYILLMVLLNIGLVDDFVLNKYVLIKGGIALVTGAIGGMIGVNLK